MKIKADLGFRMLPHFKPVNNQYSADNDPTYMSSRTTPSHQQLERVRQCVQLSIFLDLFDYFLVLTRSKIKKFCAGN